MWYHDSTRRRDGIGDWYNWLVFTGCSYGKKGVWVRFDLTRGEWRGFECMLNKSLGFENVYGWCETSFEEFSIGVELNVVTLLAEYFSWNVLTEGLLDLDLFFDAFRPLILFWPFECCYALGRTELLDFQALLLRYLRSCNIGRRFANSKENHFFYFGLHKWRELSIRFSTNPRR